MPPRVVFLDTSFFVAIENRQDSHHDTALRLYLHYIAEDASFLLHSEIITELGDGFAKLARRAKGSSLIDRIQNEERYEVVQVSEELHQAAIELYCSRPDKEWSLTDCTSFVLMEHWGIRDALTADQHFRQAGFNAMLLDN